jgi:hypothetical protein
MNEKNIEYIKETTLEKTMVVSPDALSDSPTNDIRTLVQFVMGAREDGS